MFSSFLIKLLTLSLKYLKKFSTTVNEQNNRVEHHKKELEGVIQFKMSMLKTLWLPIEIYKAILKLKLSKMDHLRSELAQLLKINSYQEINHVCQVHHREIGS